MKVFPRKLQSCRYHAAP